ncbi:hypothetical protein ACS0TY_025897 [Phlomoides rotata]
MFICGTGSFSNQDHEVEHEANNNNSPCSTPKRTRKNTSFCKIICKTTNKNPYADRGLDKFYALLADLDDKKQKIYTQKGSEDISFVRFVYTNESDNVTPIVVKVKDKKMEKENKNNLIEQRSFKSTASEIVTPVLEAAPAPVSDDRKVIRKRRCLIRSCTGNFMKQPAFYFPVMVVMILVFLAIYGRSFAILCTSIGWYLAPTIVGPASTSSSSGSERKPKRKKEYVRRLSERKLVKSAGPSSPKSVINGLQEQLQDQKKSW